MTRFQGWLTSLSVAFLALVLAGPPVWSAVSATIQHREDEPHVSGDLGTLALCVRNNAGTAVAGTDFDYIPCTTDAFGAIWTREMWKDSTGATLVDTANTAVRVSGVTRFTVQGPPMTVQHWAYDAANANTNKIVTRGTGVKIRVSRVQVFCPAENSVNVDFKLGLATTSIVALSAESSTVANKILARGQCLAGAPNSYHYTIPAAEEGASDEDLIFENEVPTGGKIHLIVAWEELTS